MGSVQYGDIKLFSCNANRPLAQAIASEMGLPLGESAVTKFSDSEISMRIYDTVRGRDIFVIQPTSPPVNDHLMELLIMTDALKRASAGRITAVMPYYGYARQDRKDRSHAPITAKLVADLLTTAGVNRVLFMDLHSPQLQGFFNVPVDHLRGLYIFARYFRRHLAGLGDFVAVSPDLGSVSRARMFAELADIPLAIVDKRRPKANVSEIMNIIGYVGDKNVVILDDIADTGGSLVGAADALKGLGCKSVYACVTHPVLSGGAAEKIRNSPLDKLIVLDTIAIPPEKRIENIEVLSVAQYFAEAIACIHEDKPISALFSEEFGHLEEAKDSAIEKVRVAAEG
jgi:ribose-phosphate pyrophosphokinase